MSYRLDNSTDNRADERKSTIKSLAGLNFLFGLWLIVSPYLLNYVTDQAFWQQTVAGVLVATLAAVRYLAPSQNWASWLIAVIGLWMIIAPFMTNYAAPVAYWNEIIFGILITLTALANAYTHPVSTHHGSHSAV